MINISIHFSFQGHGDGHDDTSSSYSFPLHHYLSIRGVRTVRQKFWANHFYFFFAKN